MWRHLTRQLLGGSLVLLIIIGLTTLAADAWYLYHFFPQTEVGGYSIANLTSQEAATLLSNKFQPDDFTLNLIAQRDSLNVASLSAQASELGLSSDYQQLTDDLLANQQALPFWQRLTKALIREKNAHQIKPKLKLDQNLTQAWVEQIAKEANESAIEPAAQLGTSNVASTLSIEPGVPGEVVDVDVTAQQIANQPEASTFEVVWKSDGYQLSDEEVEAARKKAASLIGIRLIFSSNEPRLETAVNDQDMISLLKLPEGFREAEVLALVAELAEQLDREPQDAVFEYKPGSLEVTEFVPDFPGIKVNQEKMAKQITESIDQLVEATDSAKNISLTLPMETADPKITLAETNDLGIKELIGLGKSQYAHSIPTRIHNVALATNRVSLTLVPPNQEFSFNKTLGDVSRVTGFRPAYVIKDGRTILGDGGGVCQVSTTLFRALLNAGVKITRRLPHSYRVDYYEQDMKPGVDATVYAGNTDLRFINDTPGYILIYGWADSENLRMQFQLFGTSDGRSTEIVDHLNWGYQAPPPAQYIPDPSLPPGAKKQIDWAAPGLKAKFTNVIRDTTGNEIRRDTYTSNYIPWSAKYLVGQE